MSGPGKTWFSCVGDPFAARSRMSEENNLALSVVRRSCFDQCFQVTNATTDGDVELASKNYRGERFATALTSHRFHDQVFILAEKDAVKFASAAGQFRIRQSVRVIFLCRENNLRRAVAVRA